MQKGRVAVGWFEFYKHASGVNHSIFSDRVREAVGSDTKSHMGDVDCSMLYAAVKFFKPLMVVEAGCGKGKSSWYILQALKENHFWRKAQGEELTHTYIGIDKRPLEEICCLIPKYYDELNISFVSMKSSQFFDSKKWKGLKNLGMFVHDSSHRYSGQIKEYRESWGKLGSGGVLCSHDIHYSDAFPEFVQSLYSIDSKGLTDFEKTVWRAWWALGNFGLIVKK